MVVAGVRVYVQRVGEGVVAIARPGVHFHINIFSFVCACCIRVRMCGDHKHMTTCVWKPKANTGCLPPSGPFTKPNLETTDSHLASRLALRIPTSVF